VRIGVIGTGHVGLTTCVSLAHIGHQVVGYDEDDGKIAILRRGEAPFFEKGLGDLLDSTREQLTFVSDVSKAVAGSDVVFICVGTPADADGEANLEAVERAALMIAEAATSDLVVVEKSTVPAGTSERVAATLRRSRSDLTFDVVSNPEFLREGSAVRDSLHPERILIGADSEHGAQAMRAVYSPMLNEGVPLIETDVTTAELAKHACNAYLAMKISYANALARLCERLGADVNAVVDVMGADPRIGPAFLGVGLGYGGYCFPKDVAAFRALARRTGYDFALLDEVARINDEAVDAVVDRVKDLAWNLATKRVAVLGLSFKPGTDDVRLSPAMTFVDRLRGAGAEVVGYDPQAAAEASREAPELTIAADEYEAIAGAHIVVAATAWPEFTSLDWTRARDVMADRVVVDACGGLDESAVIHAGLEYHAVGRPSRIPASD
jgi:UDPglucose 6-dehydrogenase